MYWFAHLCVNIKSSEFSNKFKKMWQGKLNVLDLLEVSSRLALGISAFLVLIRIYFKDSSLI